MRSIDIIAESAFIVCSVRSAGAKGPLEVLSAGDKLKLQLHTPLFGIVVLSGCTLPGDVTRRCDGTCLELQ